MPVLAVSIAQAKGEVFYLSMLAVPPAEAQGVGKSRCRPPKTTAASTAAPPANDRHCARRAIIAYYERRGCHLYRHRALLTDPRHGDPEAAAAAGRQKLLSNESSQSPGAAACHPTLRHKLTYLF
jgi:hypothetical protein